MSDPSIAQSRIPLSVPDLRGREGELLQKCVQDNWVSSAGPEVRLFELEVAKLTGRRHAIAVVNGTTGLHLALMIAGVMTNDFVIVPDWTFAATANAVCHTGATPFLIDIQSSDWAIDPKLVDEALRTQNGVKAVVAVDPIGHAADYDRLIEICRSHDVTLIEDAAGSIGAEYKERPCGGFGDISVISFNGNKTVTAGGGGVLLTDNDGLAERARHLSTQARVDVAYIHNEIGYNYRMTNLNAALGLAQLEQLPRILKDKAAIVARYDDALVGDNHISPMPRPSHTKNSGWLYNVELATSQMAADFVSFLNHEAVEARVFWQALSLQAPWQHCPSILRGISHRLSGRVVSLPSSSSLTVADQGRVLDAIAKWQKSL